MAARRSVGVAALSLVLHAATLLMEGINVSLRLKLMSLISRTPWSCMPRRPSRGNGWQALLCVPVVRMVCKAEGNYTCVTHLEYFE